MNDRLRQTRFEDDGWEWPDIDDDDDSDTELTPPALVQMIRDFFGGDIDVDPCAHRCGHVQARCEWRKSDDGLLRPWVDVPGIGRMRNAFVNHPYSQGQPAKWLQRCMDVRNAHPTFQIIALSKCDTSTRWFKRHVWNGADALNFIAKRIAFDKPTLEGRLRTESAKWPSLLSYYGPYASMFCEHFADLGGCLDLRLTRKLEGLRA